MEDKFLLVENTWWKNKKTGEMGFITDVQKKKGLIIFRFSQTGHVGSFTNMEFLREFEVLPRNSTPTIKNIGVTVGSIWRGAKGMEECNKGRLIKVVHINGSLISWRYLANAAGCPGIELSRYGTNTTGESSFLYCFEKVQDNDDGAIYRPFDRTHNSEKNPNKYQMVKVVETNASTTPGDFVYGEIKYVVILVSADVYSVNLEDFHSEFELFSLNPVEEFCVDANDPNHSRKLIDPNKGESKMENNGTYLKTDKDKLKDFGTGAKREDKSGKGRYDLIPGDVMSELEDFVWEAYFKNGSTTCSPTDVSKSAYFEDWKNVELYYDFIFNMVSFFFVPSTEREECEDDNGEFSYEITWDGFRSGLYEMRKSLAAHYEAGAKIHGVDNWKKGIPVYGSERGGCFLDSMRRHTDQALQGKTDEPHAVAALWNAFCAVWTLKHKPHSTMYQNASEVKAESAHFDMVDSALDALKHMTGSEDIAKVTAPSGNKYVVTKWPEGFGFAPDFETKAKEILKDMNELNYPFYDEMFESMREVNAVSENGNAMLKYNDVKYNLEKCIDVLRSIVTHENFIKVPTTAAVVYVDIYTTLIILHDISDWFQEDSNAINHIAKIISDVHCMINMKAGHISPCCRNVMMKWETCPEHMRDFVCVLGEPNADKLNILYETIGRTARNLLATGDGKVDYFCGLGITQSLLKFNTDCIKGRVEKNK